MNVLAVGGSGIVGTIVLPYMTAHHTIRVFDLSQPEADDVEYFEGDVMDHRALREAADGMDALLYMAMGTQRWREWEGSETSFNVNVTGLHFALRAIAEAGGTQAVYCSTMSIFADLQGRYFPDESVQPDEPNVYGFTKWLGEEVCRNATRRWGMDVNALRLCLPTPADVWAEKVSGDTPNYATSGDDVASAMLKALEFKGGFQAFMISGDYEKQFLNMKKARDLLGWAPLARPSH